MPTRADKVASLIDSVGQTAESLLFKSIYSPGFSPNLSDSPLQNLILQAIADTLPAEYTYNSELDGLGPEQQWCHNKLSGLPTTLPAVLAQSGYDLTHSIFWATDFSRQPITDMDAEQTVLSAMASCTDTDLLAEYCLCLVALNSICPEIYLNQILNWFDNLWDQTTLSHQALVCGILFARLGI